MSSYSSKLQETISALARKMEEEKKQWEERVNAKDVELQAYRSEVEKLNHELTSREHEINHLKEKKELLETEYRAIKTELAEKDKWFKAEMDTYLKDKEILKSEINKKEQEKKDLAKKADELENAKQSFVEEETAMLEKVLAEERLKWRETLRNDKGNND